MEGARGSFDEATEAFHRRVSLAVGRHQQDVRCRQGCFGPRDVRKSCSPSKVAADACVFMTSVDWSQNPPISISYPQISQKPKECVVVFLGESPLALCSSNPVKEKVKIPEESSTVTCFGKKLNICPCTSPFSRGFINPYRSALEIEISEGRPELRILQKVLEQMVKECCAQTQKVWQVHSASRAYQQVECLWSDFHRVCAQELLRPHSDGVEMSVKVRELLISAEGLFNRLCFPSLIVSAKTQDTSGHFVRVISIVNDPSRKKEEKVKLLEGCKPCFKNEVEPMWNQMFVTGKGKGSLKRLIPKGSLQLLGERFVNFEKSLSLLQKNKEDPGGDCMEGCLSSLRTLAEKTDACVKETISFLSEREEVEGAES